MAETRRDRFVRLAQARVTKALRQLELIGNLANRSNYEYEPDDAAKIVAALEAGVREVKKRFEASTPRDGREFRLE